MNTCRRSTKRSSGPHRHELTALRIAFARSADAKLDLERHVGPGNVAKVRSAPVTAILAYDADWHENLPALMPFATDPTWPGRTPRAGNRWRR